MQLHLSESIRQRKTVQSDLEQPHGEILVHKELATFQQQERKKKITKGFLSGCQRKRSSEEGEESIPLEIEFLLLFGSPN